MYICLYYFSITFKYTHICTQSFHTVLNYIIKEYFYEETLMNQTHFLIFKLQNFFIMYSIKIYHRLFDIKLIYIYF